jgi:N-acetylglucosamine kinase-like BadF-type ATPase
VDDQGHVVGVASGASVNPRHHQDAVIRERLDTLLSQLPGISRAAPRAVFVSLGGISTAADADAAERLVRSIPCVADAVVQVDNDATAALTGGLSGRPGLVLIAGTGSACMGRAADGRQYWCGGWESLADDAGSAYWMAVEAIRAAVRVEDGRLPASALRELVFDRWTDGAPRTLAERLSRPDADRAAIAALAPDVIALSDRDALARTIVARAADELAHLVSVTAARLFPSQSSEVILTGGLARSGPPFTPLLIQRIEAAAEGVRVIEPELPPVLGAAIEAARCARWPADGPFVAALRAHAIEVP